MPNPTASMLENDFWSAARRCAKAHARDHIGVEDVLGAFAGLARDPRMDKPIQDGLGLPAEAVAWPESLTHRWRTAVLTVAPGSAALRYEPALEGVLKAAYRGPRGFDLGVLLGRLAALEAPAARELCRLNRAAQQDAAVGLSPAGRLGAAREAGEALDAYLKERVFGQDGAVQEVVRAYIRSRLRTGASGPRAVFTLMGPPGTGKTLLARSMAAFQESEAGEGAPLLILDMSTLTGHQAHEKLWGFSKSYTDARPGILTGFVKDHPAGVILLDEIEKACPQTLQSLLGVLDRGRGRDDYFETEVDFSLTTLFLTTNLGQARLANLAGPVEAGTLLDILAAEKGLPPGYSGPPTPLLSQELVSRLGKGSVLALAPLAQADLLRVFLEAACAALKEARLPGLDLPEDAALLLLLQHAQGLDARKAAARGMALADRALLELVRIQGTGGVQDLPAAIRVELAPEGEACLRGKLTAVPLRVLVVGDAAALRPVVEGPGLAWEVCATGAEVAARLTTCHPDAVLCRVAPADLGLLPGDLSVVDLSAQGTVAVVCREAAGALDRLRRGRLLKEQVRSHRQLTLELSVQLRSRPCAASELVLVLGSPREARFVRHQDLEGPIAMLETPDHGLEVVVGQAAAKRRLLHLAEQLREPGGQSPAVKGYLLAGAPGTGKTTLARGLAGEAGVPFFALGPGDLASPMQNEGASRIREVFALARAYAPSVVFIDELDAIAPSRALPGHTLDSRQVLTTLLTCMDGIRPQDRPVFVLGATNRPDLLDQALLRPGRFDAVIPVQLPGLEDRKLLLLDRLAAIPGQADLDLDPLAGRSMGCSHADLDGLVREARTAASWEGRRTVTQEDLHQAFSAARLGGRAEGGGHAPGKKRLIAAHEAGHALVRAALMPDTQVTRVDIVPRSSGIGGVTESLPAEGGFTFQTRRRLGDEVAVLLAGRAAEYLLSGSEDLVTDGCQGDLEQATLRVRHAVTRCGLDPELGLVSLELKGAGAGVEALVHRRTAAWIAEGYQKALAVLRQNAGPWERMVERLMAEETLEGAGLEALLRDVDGEPPLTDC